MNQQWQHRGHSGLAVAWVNIATLNHSENGSKPDGLVVQKAFE